MRKRHGPWSYCRRLRRWWVDQHLAEIVVSKPRDYKAYGGQVPDEDRGGDCSCTCCWWLPLEHEGDYGVCSNPKSERCGLLTWEHQAGHDCYEFDKWVDRHLDRLTGWDDE